MGHAIRAFVGPLEAMRRAAAAAPGGHGRLVALDAGGLALVPLTDELHDALAPDGGTRLAPFSHLSDTVLAAFAALVGDATFGYLETDYFGGTGTQFARAWRAGQPLALPEDIDGEINGVLVALGVVPPFPRDAFAHVGLGRYRSLDALEDAATAQGVQAPSKPT